MTRVVFLTDSGRLCGFDISGHSTASAEDEQGRYICAAVSSAVYMTVNTVTDVLYEKAEISIDEEKGLFRLCVKQPSQCTVKLLKGFKLHIEQLSLQYESNIRIDGGANNA